jgi:hypothetical protein
MRRRLVIMLVAVMATPAGAHHTGVYAPKDNAITTNFRDVKFSVQAGKFDVARRRFDEGPLRAEMRARAASLPSGLESRTRAALEARDAAGVEESLMIFFLALARDLAREADRQLAAGPSASAATAQRFLEAIWRYYNLVDFAVSQRHPATSTAMRLAYDEADSAVRASPAADAARLRATFQRIDNILSRAAPLQSRGHAPQSLAGVSGSSVGWTSSGDSASATALASAAAGPSVPPSPTPRTPIRLAAGTSMCSMSSGGTVVAIGSAYSMKLPVRS